MIYAALSELRNETKYPYSSGLPRREAGTNDFILSSTSVSVIFNDFDFSLFNSLILSVSKYPVKIELTVIPSGPRSTDRLLAHATTADLILLDKTR